MTSKESGKEIWYGDSITEPDTQQVQASMEMTMDEIEDMASDTGMQIAKLDADESYLNLCLRDFISKMDETLAKKEDVSSKKDELTKELKGIVDIVKLRLPEYKKKLVKLRSSEYKKKLEVTKKNVKLLNERIRIYDESNERICKMLNELEEKNDYDTINVLDDTINITTDIKSNADNLFPLKEL